MAVQLPYFLGGRLVISTYTSDDQKIQQISQKDSRLMMSGQLVIKQMFESGIITQASLILLPSRSEQHEVLQVGSIQEGILQAHH